MTTLNATVLRIANRWYWLQRSSAARAAANHQRCYQHRDLLSPFFSDYGADYRCYFNATAF